MFSYKSFGSCLSTETCEKRPCECGGFSTYTINTLNCGDNVTTDLLVSICKALGCNIGDIMDGDRNRI